MFPLIALPKFPTSVKYEELGDLQRHAWDEKVLRDPQFLQNILKLQSMEKEIAELALNIQKKEPYNALVLLRENNYELIHTWKRAKRKAFCERLTSKVFIESLHKSINERLLIPLEFDIDEDMIGINVKNDKDFERIDIGMEEACYEDEANYTQGLDDCIYNENLWDALSDNLRIVYKFEDGKTMTLFEIQEYEYPRFVEVEARNSILDENDVETSDELIVQQNGLPDDVFIETSLAGGWDEWPVKRKEYAQLFDKAVKPPIMTFAFWITKSNPKEMETEHGQMWVDTWKNIGIGFYAIPIDILARIVDRFETKLKLDDGRARQRH